MFVYAFFFYFLLPFQKRTNRGREKEPGTEERIETHDHVHESEQREESGGVAIPGVVAAAPVVCTCFMKSKHENPNRPPAHTWCTVQTGVSASARQSRDNCPPVEFLWSLGRD